MDWDELKKRLQDDEDDEWDEDFPEGGEEEEWEEDWDEFDEEW